MNYKTYKEIVEKNKPKVPLFKNMILAFMLGGTLGIIQEAVYNLALNVFSYSEDLSAFFSCMVIILIGIILTMFSLFNKLARIFGAGIFIPTTGFANTLTSEAMEKRSEGLVTGIGASIFNLAGSVILYGLFFAIYFASIYYFLNLLGINIWA